MMPGSGLGIGLAQRRLSIIDLSPSGHQPMWDVTQTVVITAAEQPATPLLATLDHLPEHTHPLNQMLYLEGKHFLCDHNLNYTDKMGMAVGVEIRVPLLDPDLIALAARLPIQYKQHGHIGKWIFKQAMEPYEDGQPIVYVHIQDVAPQISRLINPKIQIKAA